MIIEPIGGWKLKDLVAVCKEKDPKRTSDLIEVWETFDITSRELVDGLYAILEADQEYSVSKNGLL